MVACATMVLQYLGIDSNYRRLFRLLGASDAGTPFFNIERLTTLGLFARWQRYGSLDLVQQYLELGLPVIVAVRTWALPHWHPTDNEHAIVVVGFDDEAIYVNDPFFNEAPLLIPRERFLNGWADRDEQFALISLIESG